MATAQMAGLLVAECDTALGEVIGRHLHSDTVTGKNLDIVHAHLAGDVGSDFMSVFKFHTEHRVAEGFDDNAVLFDCCLFCHKLLVELALV